MLNGVLTGGKGRILQQSTGTRMRFEFSASNMAYAKLLELSLSSLISNPATKVNRAVYTRTGTIYKSTRFGTMTLPSMNCFYDRAIRPCIK